MYNNPIPVAVCLIRFEIQETISLLAIRRGIEPCIGGLAFPGGYLDDGETAEQAASREMIEETGIVTQWENWKPITTRITPQNRLLLFMLHREVLSENKYQEIMENFRTHNSLGETQELVLLDNPTKTLCFPLHEEILNNWGLWLPYGTPDRIIRRMNNMFTERNRL